MASVGAEPHGYSNDTEDDDAFAEPETDSESEDERDEDYQPTSNKCKGKTPKCDKKGQKKKKNI